MKTIFLYLSLVFILILSASSKTPKTKYWIGEKDIPGIQFIDEEFGMDRTEITNFHWCEFLYWINRTYGSESEEYQSLLPDTTMWLQLDTAIAYKALSDFYLSHPAFRNYPVVGISYEQAEKYCKWRSDRVFEYLLIKFGYWIWDKALECDSTNFVTIERYQNGELKDIPVNAKINRLPHYHLPSEKEWYKAMKYNEEQILKLSKAQLKQLKSAKGVEIYKNKSMPAPVLAGHGKIEKEWIFYLDRNVSELLNNGSAIGSNWSGKPQFDAFSVADVNNAFVGFRCAFDWKQPKKQDSQ